VRHGARSTDHEAEAPGSSGVTGDLMLFDVRGEAVCPTCGARYRRTLNVIALAE
jgi:hypothetical protein